MSLAFPSALLLLSAALCCLLGVGVILRNPHKRTHRAFGVLTLNLALWALGVFLIIHSHEAARARFWVIATFIVAAPLPANYYRFICLFPRQRFEGVRGLQVYLYASALVVSVLALVRTDLYLTAVTVHEINPPEVEYGPIFQLFGLSVVLSMLFTFVNLFRKLRTTQGVERRQVEHVLLGIFVSTMLTLATNILAPILEISSYEAYGPIFTVIMMLIFAHAMVRYHLLDIWLIFSRTTVYAVVTGLVVLIFVMSVGLVHWLLNDGDTEAKRIGSTILAALLITLVLQPIKERVQSVFENALLKRRYDVNRLLARISQNAAEMVRFDELLRTVAADIQQTVGVQLFRVLLVDEKEPSVLVVEHSSQPGEQGQKLYNHAALLQHMRREMSPLVLEKMIHDLPSPSHTQIVKHLAELDAYLCVPLKTSSGLVGMLTLGQKTSRDIYSTDDLVVFTALAGPLGTAIENARLYRKLEEVNLHRARILSHMRGAVIAVDTDGRITTLNQAAKDLLGPVQLGDHYDRLVPEIAEMLRTALHDQRAINDFEMVMPGPDGESISIVVSSSCLKTANNDTVGAMAMIYDLTAIKRLEQNVQRADRLSSLGTLAAGMAHEIKNPLVSIKTFTQLLLSRYDDPDFRATFSEIVPHEVERIDSIVLRLLDFARPKPPRFEFHNLRTVVEDVLALVDNELRKGCVTVRKEFPEEYIEIRGDEQQLHQVFLNLVLNALDALRETEGGNLTVRVDYDRAHLRPNGQLPFQETDVVRVSFSDSGCGMSSENLQRIFTPFFTTKPNGSGLGLSVVHGIITEHGGEIDVDSVPGEGTTFTVTLPLSRSASSVEDV